MNFKHWAYCLISFTCSIGAQAEQNFTYDANGNIISSLDASYEYNGNNQCVRIAYASGKEVHFTYDACGNKTEMKDSRGVTRFEYDHLGRTILTVYPGGHAVRYAYDARGNLAALIYPDGEEVGYAYDEGSRLIEVKDETGLTKYEYFPSSQQVKKVTLPNKTTIHYTYGDGGRVATVIYKTSKGLLLGSAQYTYDLNGLVTKTETKTTRETITAVYVYDRLNRPVKVVYSDGRFEGYTYDAFGNCLSRSTEKGMATYQFDVENRLVKSDDTEFFYDASGNLTKKVSPLGNTEYVYDGMGRLVEYKTGDHKVSFEYDSDGNRVAKTVNGVRTIFINGLASSENVTLMELSSDQKGKRPLIKKYRYGLSRISQQIEDDLSYFLDDPVTGHVALLITNNERKSNRYEYDLFGNKKNNQRSLSNSYGFCTAAMDIETGLIYLDGRYYDPQIGRFLTKDIELTSLYEPQHLNPYAFRTKINEVRKEAVDESYKIALSPNFQGVSHQKTRAFMEELHDLDGAILDRGTGQIIFFAADKPEQDPLCLSDLYFALTDNQKIGIFTEDDQSAESSTLNYMGPTPGTHIGNVLYEADRLVKNLLVGIDNVSGEIVSSEVSGFDTFIDRCLARDIKGVVSHEHWLYPERVSLLESSDQSALFVEGIKMGMTASATHNNSPLNKGVVSEYQDHFIDHFEELAAEYPILGTLSTLEKFMGVGKWVRQQNLQIDTALFVNLSPFETPQKTAIYRARKNKLPYVENGPFVKNKRAAHYEANYLTITERGGILCDLTPEKLILSASPVVDDLKNGILAARPSENDFVWKLGDFTAVAQVLSLTPKLGNTRKTFTDMSFPALGAHRLELTRTYNAFDEKWEWTPASLKMLAAGIVLAEHGRETLYVQDKEAPTLYRSPYSSFALVKHEDGSFSLDKGLDGKIAFDASGRLDQLTDGNGISIRYEYEEGRLSAITHQNGRAISLYYMDGILSRAVGPGGKTLYYKHNDKGQLISVADRRWNLSSYQYDDEGRLSALFDAKDQLVETIQYDIYNRAIQKNGIVQRFNHLDRTVQVQNPLNLVTIQQYDDHFRLVCAVDSQNRSLRFFYKEGMQTPEKVIDSLGNTTLYNYDGSGNLISMQDPLGNVYSFVYDSSGCLISYENPQGNVVHYSYDAKKRLTAASTGTRYTYDEAGNLTSLIDAQGNVYAYAYDEHGMLIESRSPNGFVETRTYDDRSRLTRISDSSGKITDYGYDDRDRLIAKGNETYDYDDNGNLERVRDGNGHETAFSYDLHNNLIQVTDPEGGVTRYEYDAMKHLTKAVFPNGSTKEIRFDAAGQKVAVK